jgi:uncharacterized membrane protein
MDAYVLARVLHVLAVVHWIGGVAMVTLVILPQMRALPACRPDRDVRAAGGPVRRAGEAVDAGCRAFGPVDAVADRRLGAVPSDPPTGGCT